jgi:hypothetical protein
MGGRECSDQEHQDRSQVHRFPQSFGATQRPALLIRMPFKAEITAHLPNEVRLTMLTAPNRHDQRHATPRTTA